MCALPIGIPFDKFQQLAQDAPRLVRDSDLKIILSVDRLDYTKGLAHRLRAFEHFLVAHPEHIEQVLFCLLLSFCLLCSLLPSFWNGSRGPLIHLLVISSVI